MCLVIKLWRYANTQAIDKQEEATERQEHNLNGCYIQKWPTNHLANQKL